MPPVKLTVRLVKGVKVTKDTILWDADLPGFYLRVSASGVKSFGVWYRVRGRAKRHSLGRYPVVQLQPARERAQEILSEARLRDEDITVTRDTFAGMVGRFIVGTAKRRADTSQAEYLRLLEKRVKPSAVGKMEARKVTRKDIRDLVNPIAAEAPVAANMFLKMLKAACRWAVTEELLLRDPTLGVDKPGDEKPRARVLSDDEIKTMWRAVEGHKRASYVRTLLLLGQRPTETALMERSEINGDVWVIPAEKHKGETVHVVPLPAFALEQIAGEGNRVFPHVKREATAKWFRGFRDKVGQEWMLRDLRRTCASGIARLGFTRDQVALVLGHELRSGGSVTAVYDRYARLEERRAALTAWNEYVRRLVFREPAGSQ